MLEFITQLLFIEVKKNPSPASAFPAIRPPVHRTVVPVGASIPAAPTTSLPVSVSTLQQSFNPLVSSAVPQSNHGKSFLRLTPHHIQKPGTQGPTALTQDTTLQPSPLSSGQYPYGYSPYPYPYPYSYAQLQSYGSGIVHYPITSSPMALAINGSNSGSPLDTMHATNPQTSPTNESVAQSSPVVVSASSTEDASPSSVPSTQAWPYSYYNSTLTSPSVSGHQYLHLPPNMHAYYQQHYARLLSGNAGVASAVAAAITTTKPPSISPQDITQPARQPSLSSSSPSIPTSATSSISETQVS